MYIYLVLWHSMHLQPLCQRAKTSFIINVQDPKSSEAFTDTERRSYTCQLFSGSISAHWFHMLQFVGRLCRFLLLQFHLKAQGLWQVEALSQGMTSTLPCVWTFQRCWGGDELLAYEWYQIVTSYWNILDACCRSYRVARYRHFFDHPKHVVPSMV